MAQSIVNEAVNEAATEPAQGVCRFCHQSRAAAWWPSMSGSPARDAGLPFLSPSHAHSGAVHPV